MPHDLFISYAHQGDNTSREAVAALLARLHSELESDFRRRFNRDLEIFFDKSDIRDFHHWQVQCHRALRDSRFFIACLSRTCLRSDACRWEWEEWCRHELEHGLVGQGAAREIVRLLGSFTLAVESAAVYLGQFANDVTCAAFLARLKKEGLEGLDTAASQSSEEFAEIESPWQNRSCKLNPIQQLA